MKPIMTHLTDDAWELDQAYIAGDVNSIRWQTLVNGEHTAVLFCLFPVTAYNQAQWEE